MLLTNVALSRSGKVQTFPLSRLFNFIIDLIPACFVIIFGCCLIYYIDHS